jgi:hypothetical protein
MLDFRWLLGGVALLMATGIAADGWAYHAVQRHVLAASTAKLAGLQNLQVTGFGDAELILIEVPWSSVQSACGPDSLPAGPRSLGML